MSAPTPQALTLPKLELRTLHQRLHALAQQAPLAENSILELLQLLLSLSNAAGAAYCLRNAQGQMQAGPRILSRQAQSWHDNLEQLILEEVARACDEDKLQTRVLDETHQAMIFACPVYQHAEQPPAHGIALVLVLGSQSREMFAMLLQLLAAHLSVRLSGAQACAKEADKQGLLPLFALSLQIFAAQDFKQGIGQLSSGLQREFGCQRVALGLLQQRRCRLFYVSELADIRRQAEFTHAAEGLFNACMLSGEALDSQDSETRRRHADIVRTLTLTGSEALYCLPLRQHAEAGIDAVLLFIWPVQPAQAAYTRLQAAAPALGAAVYGARRANPGRLQRISQYLRQHRLQRWLLVLVPSLLALLMLLPVPHKISGTVTLEPTVRRIVAAPFDGILARSFKEPGDLVDAQNLLAQMDPREIKWSLAGLEAELARTEKQKDASRAARDTAATQIAELEIERIKAEIALLQYRMDNLDIKSPIAGMLLSGDLSREEGSPLQQGETLFEVAPLQQMLAEVAISAEDIDYVAANMPMELYLDAYPGEHWSRSLERIRPRAQVIDGRNVFILEARLDNPEERLRPGMRGQARVIAGERSLGWVLFHKVWENIARWLR